MGAGDGEIVESIAIVPALCYKSALPIILRVRSTECSCKGIDAAEEAEKNGKPETEAIQHGGLLYQQSA